MSEQAVQTAEPESAPPAPGCEVTDTAGRPCVLEAGHQGAHGVAMGPLEVVRRQAVQVCIAHRDRTLGRSALLHSTEVKLDMVLNNQAAILNGLALVLDAQLVGAGLPGEIRMLPPNGGDGRA